MTDYYPPVGFHFIVDFSAISSNDLDVRFQSVSGLTVDIELKPRKEGGENRFQHYLPLHSKYETLILKRGMVLDSDLINWCQEAFENFDIQPIDLIVSLLNEKHEPLRSWNVINAWPIKWSISDFDAEQDNLVIEQLHLHYNYFRLI